MKIKFTLEREENSSYMDEEVFRMMYYGVLFYFFIFFSTIYIMREFVENYLLISFYIGVILTSFLIVLRIFNKALMPFSASVHLTLVFSFTFLMLTGKEEIQDYIGYNSIKGYSTHNEYVESSSFDGTDYTSTPTIEKIKIIEADSWVGENLVEGIGYLLILVLGLYLYINYKLY